MQLTHITCLLLFLLASNVTLADEDSSTETNEIIPREAIQKLDYSVRQALLRAIDKLEQEASEDDDNENETNAETKEETTTITPSSITIQSTTALPLTTAPNTKDEILEESTSSSDIFPSVQFFTATYDENSAQEQPLALFIDKSKKSKNKNLGSPVLVSTNVKEDSKSNNQAARSINNNNNLKTNEISLNSLDEIKFEIRNSKSATTEASIKSSTTTTTPRPRTTKKRITTTTTTTTTTPRPTHNEDGENIEVVAKDDIRIQAAPLVSAFTVDLDELGSAKKVIPIIDSPASTAATIAPSTQRSSIFQPPLFGPTITRLNVLPAESQRPAAINLASNLPPAVGPTQATFGSSTSSNIFSNIVPTSGHYITKQPLTTNLNQQQPQQQQQQGGVVNNYLIEKQRELEQQIYQLKVQAQQQQELIIRQLKLLEEQTKQQRSNNNNNNNPTTATHLSLTNVQHQQNQQLPLLQQKQESGFTIRPSVEFIQSTQSKISPIFPSYTVEQQLPLKDANGKYINGLQQQNNGFSNNNNNNNNNNVQPQNQQLQQQQQRLPIETNPIQHVFQKLQSLQTSNTQGTTSISSIQIQPSNQLNIAPTFASLLPPVPDELSLVQALPQRNYQQFQQSPLVPQYVTNALLERQQQQQQQLQEQQNRARLFRQEGDTANIGVNQVQIQPSNNVFTSFNQQQQQQQQLQQATNNFDNQHFYRQHLIPAFSNQLQQNAQQFYQQQQQQQQQQSQLNSQQTALNHGINNFAPQPLLPTSQSSTAPGTQPLAQSALFNSNIF
ncbi:uncharacterized protein ACRADG_012702 isoform 2-T2 [Cochliomyia hominivorax]